MLIKIISGGQNGVDIASLAIAKKYGIYTGGCIPQGFITLDGPKPEYAKLYGLTEHSSSHYAPRTFDNVKNSDATLRIFTVKDSAGEICTLKAINQYNKPYFDVDLNNPIAATDVADWIVKNNISTLNVAGNSEKTSPGIAKKTIYYLNDVFKALGLSIPSQQINTNPSPKDQVVEENDKDPDFSVKEIEKICKEKLRLLNLHDNEKYISRLDFEIKQIDAQMEGDYLYDLYMKKDKFLKNENNLLVAYLLELVNDFDIDKDPFMLQGEFPDIDTDFQADVCKYIRSDWAPKIFGEENICAIGTYGTFGIKQSLQDIARVFGKDRQEVLNITTKMGMKDEEGKALSWEKALEEYPDLKKYCDDNPEVADAAERLLNRNKSVGTHAGGLIISNQRIDNIVPFVKTSDNIVSAFGEGLSGTDLSPLGLVKIDTLRLTNLTQIAEICRFVQQRHNLQSICALPGRPNWSDEDAYIKDEKALKLANDGHLKCIFQFDSDGIRDLVKKSGIDSFNDLVSISALWRPGPLGSKMDKTFVERKRGREVYNLHPVLEPILKDTYGIMIFQEQTLKILKTVGLIPDMHCEIVRKAISKKKEKVFKKYKDMFIRNGQKVLNWSKEQVEELWQQIQNFAEYGFNKSVTKNTLIPFKNGIKEIQHFVPGDIVYCVNNKGETVETEVVALHDHGYLDGFEVTFDDGYKITCSENHKFLTEDGQVSLKEICKYGSYILCDPKFTQYKESYAKEKRRRLGKFLWNSSSKQKNVFRAQKKLQNLQRNNNFKKVGNDKEYSKMQIKICDRSRNDKTSEFMSRMQKSCLEKRYDSYGSMWNEFSNMEIKGATFERMRNLRTNKTKKYSRENEETKFRKSISRKKKNIFGQCKKNILTSRNKGCSLRKVKNLERKQSRKVDSIQRESLEKCKNFKNGNMVEKTVGLANKENKMFKRKKTSRFCKRKNLDRSGWFLSFFRTQKQQRRKPIQIAKSSKKRSNVKQRMFIKKRCDVNKIKHGMFSFLDRGNEVGYLGLGSTHDKIANTRNLVRRKIIRIRSVGRQHMFDLEVSNPTHNFILPTGIITSNSHSVAYTLVSARLLYLKAHYPLEFFAGTLKCVDSDEKIKEYKREAEKMGVKIHPVTINKSKVKFDIVDDEIYMGYSNIKGLGDEVAEKIVKNQPYSSFEDFLARGGTEEKVLKPLICLRTFENEDPIKLYSYYSYYKEEIKKLHSMNDRYAKKAEKTKLDISSLTNSSADEIINETYDYDAQQFEDYCIKKSYDYKPLYKLVSDYKKSKETNEKKNSLKMSEMQKYVDHKLDVSSVDDSLLDILRDVVQIAESKFYGFTWNHLIETSEDYIGNHTFKDFENDSEALVKMCEVQVVAKPKKKSSKKGTVYYEVAVEDSNSIINYITFWEEDYLRFKEELEWWESDTRKGNFIKIRLKKPDPPFKNYTFDSPPKNIRFKEVPQNKEDDTRLLVMSRPFIPLKKIDSNNKIETIIL